MSLRLIVCTWPRFFLTSLTVFNKKTLDSLFQVRPLKQIQPISHKPSSSTPSRQHHVPHWSPSAPTQLLPPISEQITKHLKQQKQQRQQPKPSSHVSGQQKSRENISRQLRAGQKARQEPRGRKPNPVVTQAVSSDDLASASDLKLSPCRRLDVDDELVPQIAINQECLITNKDSILSQSAPEHSLREVMRKGQRSNSMPSKDLLMVPQWEWAVPLATYDSDDSLSANRSSSALDLSVSMELFKQSFSRPIWRSKSCEREAFWFSHRKSQKQSTMAAPLRSVLRWMGLSPRSSPRGSPASSRSPSPSSHSPLANFSPLDSPFSSSNVMTIRPLVN